MTQTMNLQTMQDSMHDGVLGDAPGARYAAFGLRVKQLFAVKSVSLTKLLAANARYTAYSSDIMEAFRPVVSPFWVYAGYGVAISYIGLDVGYSAYKEARKPDGNVPRAVAHATLFQGLASLVIPAVAIHQTVHFTKHYTRGRRLGVWAPTVAGLSLIPILPFTIDPPVELALESAFNHYWPEREKPHSK